MIIKAFADDCTKICHARPGDVVQLVGSDLAKESELFLVCTSISTPATFLNLGSSGLYMIDNAHLHIKLTSLVTGFIRDLPHLSSRCLIYRKAEVHVGKFLESSKA